MVAYRLWAGTKLLPMTKVEILIEDSRVVDNVAGCPSAPVANAQGGGIYNAGTFEAESTLVDSNWAFSGGGISNTGQVTMTGGSISGNEGYNGGGGLFNRGTAELGPGLEMASNRTNSFGAGIFSSRGALSLVGVRMHHNNAQNSGGGIYNSGGLEVRDTAIYYNRTDRDGGGLYNFAGSAAISHSLFFFNTTTDSDPRFASGGAIWNGDAHLTLTNTTLSFNGSGAGGAIYFSTNHHAKLSNVTLNNNVAHDGAAILYRPRPGGRSVARFVVKNTIIADSVGGANCVGPVESAGYNLESDDTCHFTSSTDGVRTDPRLQRLADNGGPTRTQALSLTSPAVDAIPPDACTDVDGNPLRVDQRGEARPHRSRCDIGAYEWTEEDR